MSMLFPAAHIIGAVPRRRRPPRAPGGGKRTGDVATAVTVVAMSIVILTSTVSHFRMPMQPVIFADYLRFLQPLVRESDTVFLNLPRPFISLWQFGDVDRFVTSPWCIQAVNQDSNWLRVGLEPQCSFADDAFGLTFTPPEIDAAHAAHQMHRISYVFFIEPTTQRPARADSRALPEAEVLTT
jgi:hypothetical protein